MSALAGSQAARGRDTGSPATAVLTADGLTKSYGSIHACSDVGFTCAPGEVHALVGENGAGKSTLAKMLAGLVVPDGGTIQIAGRDLSPGSVRRAHAAGVYCVLQELSLVPAWSVAENLVLRDRTLAGRFNRRAAGARARAILARHELDLDPAVRVQSLSLAHRQQLEIVANLEADPRVLILDEATSALSPPAVQWLFQRLRELTELGAGVIYVTHRLAELREIADSGTILRDGRVVAGFDRASFDPDVVVTAMAGRPLTQAYPARPDRPVTTTSALLVEDLVGSGLHKVTLSVAPGEILGVGGLQGHGQTELLAALFGVLPVRAACWQVAGSSVHRLTPTQAVRLGIGFVPEERKTQGLALGLGVAENLLVPWLRPSGAGGRLAERRHARWIGAVLRRLQVRAATPRVAARTLSGGNQQKLVFGRWIDRRSRVLLLHDPSRGIDVGAKNELYHVIAEVAAGGTAVVWFSTEVEELVHLCHRVLVLYRGRIVDELEGERLTRENVVGATVGLRSADA